MADTRRWAEEQFGHSELGDARRTARLVALAAEVAHRPAGLVTRACASSASREGAFRLLENGAVRPEAVRDSVVIATVRACEPLRRAIVPVDGTSLGLTEGTRSRGLGGVGAWKRGGRGMQVMTAVALTEGGAMLGMCGQKMWVRKTRSTHGERGANGRASENGVWLELLGDSRAAFAAHAPGCEPWFQLDRGADSRDVLVASAHAGLLVTVRATHDRSTCDKTARLWATLERAPVLARRQLRVPARPPSSRNKRIEGKRIHVWSAPRRARLATLDVRAAQVPVRFTTPKGRTFVVELNAVLVREIGVPANERLEWLLLTTHPIDTPHDALEVARAYALRWRIEEFHRLWKRGLCRVEDTQLQSRDAIAKWATLLAAVATRAMHLTHLARTTPQAPATTELSNYELMAVFALRRPKGADPSAVPTLALAVRWIAEIGGHSGPWRGPPGATTVGRGLHDVTVAARAFEFSDEKR